MNIRISPFTRCKKFFRFDNAVFAILITLFSVGISRYTFHSNPMEDWKGLGLLSDATVPETIKQDARNFFQSLPNLEMIESRHDDSVTYCEDGTGEHAVIFRDPHDGQDWYYALIYDTANHRVKVLKYSTSSSMS